MFHALIVKCNMTVLALQLQGAFKRAKRMNANDLEMKL